jgi:hypothetical protein
VDPATLSIPPLTGHGLRKKDHQMCEHVGSKLSETKYLLRQGPEELFVTGQCDDNRLGVGFRFISCLGRVLLKAAGSAMREMSASE